MQVCFNLAPKQDPVCVCALTLLTIKLKLECLHETNRIVLSLKSSISGHDL